MIFFNVFNIEKLGGRGIQNFGKLKNIGFEGF